jgi:hypothetical protein
LRRPRRLAVWLLVAAAGWGSAQAAAPRDVGDHQPASRQVREFTDGDGPCDKGRVQEAVSLIFEQDDVETAASLATRCELLALSQGRPFSKTIASRIKALIAMRVRDMAALKQAGESLVAEAQVPEYVADGHLFIAFACVFGGDAKCARQHVDSAKSMFTQLHVGDALMQLKPLEQTLLKLEQQDAPEK